MNISTISKLERMKSTTDFTLMIASRNKDALKVMGALVNNVDNCKVISNHICNGHLSPLYSLTDVPQLLLFWIGDQWELELHELINNAHSGQPPLIILSNTDDRNAMRMAMKAGAIDYFQAPIDKSELIATIESVQDEYNVKNKPERGSITAVINAKGGAGATFIAGNLAHIIKETTGESTAILGLDIQFGSFLSYLDLVPEYGLVDALNNVNDIDSAALDGYMVKHPSGLHVLDVKSDELLMLEDIDCESLDSLLVHLTNNYKHVIIDLPRQIDLVTSTVIERCDKLMVVLQQCYSHLHDAKRLLKILTRDLGVSAKSIDLIVNRYSDYGALSLQEIAQALNHPIDKAIPNSYGQVNECINEGELLYSKFKRSAITKAMLGICEDVVGGAQGGERPMLSMLLNKIKEL